VILGMALSLCAASVFGGDEPPIHKGMIGVLTLPCDFILSESVITSGPNGLQVDGHDLPSPTSAPPCMITCNVFKSKVQKDGSIDVEMLGGRYFKRLRFSTPLPAEAFAKIFVNGAEADAVLTRYRAHLAEGLRREFFGTPPLSELSDAAQRELVGLAFVDGDLLMRFAISEFKGGRFLTTDLGLDRNVYNEERLKQSERVALLLNKQLLSLMRVMEPHVRALPGMVGLKIQVGIAHESFVDKDDPRTIDRLEIYAPADLLLKFAGADITAKKLLEGSVLLINGNRMEVPSEL
jgi:hypothetical protein